MQQAPGGKAEAEAITDLKRRIAELERANRSPDARPLDPWPAISPPASRPLMSQHLSSPETQDSLLEVIRGWKHESLNWNGRCENNLFGDPTGIGTGAYFTCEARN